MILRSLLLRVFSTSTRRMSVFTKRLNPITGKEEWEIQDENYDFHQEIARSAFADMLHDSERNKKYYIGIRRAIDKMHNLGKKANVLDIGTGTGLLSMMAVKCGADSVVACEAFQPMADCAMKIIHENGFSGKIEVIRKRSTELKVGENEDLKKRANILVTEVFDTELIGEGAISTFNHAHQELLERDCIVVPTSSTMYAQVVSSPLAQQWNRLEPVSLEGRVLLETPDAVKRCAGAAAVHDVQLSQFDEANFESIVAPVPVFRFDWSGRTALPFSDSSTLVVRADRDGTAQVVFVWWDIVMDTDGEVVLSCAPSWAHPDADHGKDGDKSEGLPWRDHWMQALYYLPQEVPLKRGEEAALVSCHDEYSLWFNMKKDLTVTDSDRATPCCTCGVHLAFGRTRIGAMNDARRNGAYLHALRGLVQGSAPEHKTGSLSNGTPCKRNGGMTPDPSPPDLTTLLISAPNPGAIVCLGNGTLLGLAAAALGAARVFYLEEHVTTKRVLEAYIECNEGVRGRVTEIATPEEIAQHTDKISLVFGEPHFLTTLLPWQNVAFWYLKQRLQECLPGGPIKAVMPSKAVVWAMPVQFRDLWKIRAPLNSVEGFAMSLFDELIDASSDVSDSPVEAQPLWEYPCVPLGEPFPALNFDFARNTETEMAQGLAGTLTLRSGTCHGVVIWVDWDLDGSGQNVVTTGPIRPPEPHAKVVWDMHTRQGVSFLKQGTRVKDGDVMRYSAEFERGDVRFSFKFD